MDVDLQIPLTNMVEEVGGQEDLERVMVADVWPTNLDDEVKSVCPLALVGVPTLVLVGVPPLALARVRSLCPKNSTYHGSPHWMGTLNWGGDVDAQVPPINMKDKMGGQQRLERVVKAEVGVTNLEFEGGSVGQPPLALAEVLFLHLENSTYRGSPRQWARQIGEGC